jgi:hypothetical protein
MKAYNKTPDRDQPLYMNDGRPSIIINGEVDGKKRGFVIKGEGCNLYEGCFNANLHGVEMKGVGIRNGDQSVADISDIKTDSSIENTGKSFMKLRRAEIFLKNELKIKFSDKKWYQIVIFISALFTIIVGLIKLLQAILKLN